WSSDVCSSDLGRCFVARVPQWGGPTGDFGEPRAEVDLTLVERTRAQRRRRSVQSRHAVVSFETCDGMRVDIGSGALHPIEPMQIVGVDGVARLAGYQPLGERFRRARGLGVWYRCGEVQPVDLGMLAEQWITVRRCRQRGGRARFHLRVLECAQQPSTLLPTRFEIVLSESCRRLVASGDAR